MKRVSMLRKGIGLVLVLAFMALPALAENGPEVENRGLDLTETVSVRYPAVTGMADEQLQDAVNAKIQAACGIEDYLARAAQLISEGSLRTEWRGGILGEDVFSCAVSAQGTVKTPRETHVWTACSLDLRDGHEIGWAELFTDEAVARDLIGIWLESEIAPGMSAHLQNSELTPLPELFYLETSGLRLLYPVDQLSTLSDRAGDIRVGWHVLRDVLDLTPGGVADRMGIAEMITLSADSAEKLRGGAAEGSLPGIPAKLGDPLRELTDRYHLLTDPDGFEEGRMFALEGGDFQGVFLLTDDLARSWDQSVVQGIRMDEGCAWGLCIRETARGEWLEILGEPVLTETVDAEKAELNRIEPGQCDYYTCGEHTLRLYSDETGTLTCLVLAE